MIEKNKGNQWYHIFMDTDVNNWTWEVCLYNLNKSLLDEKIKLKEGAEYLVHGQECGSKVLGKMLNNKVEMAYLLLKNKVEFEIPQYVKDAIEWLNK